MARTAKPAHTAPRKNSTNGDADASALSDALQINFGVARNVLGGSLAALQGCLQCAEQVQRTNAEAMNDFSNVVSASVDQAEYATLPEFLEMYRALATGQFTRAAQYYGSLLVRLSEVEANLIQQAYAAASARSSALIGALASQWRGNGAKSPLGTFGEAQAAWPGLTQQWLQLMTSLPAPHPARDSRPSAGEAR